MDQLDVYYRALTDYRQQTVADNKCTAQRNAIATTDIEQDKIEVIRSTCKIDEDWVDAIEAGLVHIEKAIKEERQFIRSNGEVVPIEKVKHVSKETVEHLAKHSNLISRYEEGEDIIPDKLYTVERLNDYTVYENRFLYMLLCYIRDFVTLRYNDILDKTNKYEATVYQSKRVITGKEKLTYTLSMHDIRRDDPYLKANNPAREVIDRIDLILKAVLAFLATPLMEEVAKAPMLKPPITKTNVLKMNNNFKGAMALYEFIIAYDKAGYTVTTETKSLAPFRDELADEFAEPVGLATFLAYEYGLGIKAELKESYDREEQRRKAEKIKQDALRIEKLKRSLENSQITPEEYIVELENHLRDLEGASIKAEALAEELSEEQEKNRQLADNIVRLNSEINALNENIEELIRKQFEEIQTLKAAHEDEMHKLVVEQAEKINALNVAHSEELRRVRAAAEESRKKQAEELAAAKNEAKEREAAIKAECNDVIRAAEEKVSASEEETARVRAEYNALAEAKKVAEARIKALGGISGDYTDRDSFNELEREYQAFTRVYMEQWEKTKKQIQKNHLSMKNLRAKKKKGKGKGESPDSD